MIGKKREEVDRRRGKKTIIKNGQKWILPAQLGQLKTGQGGEELLRSHLWCPDQNRIDSHITLN